MQRVSKPDRSLAGVADTPPYSHALARLDDTADAMAAAAAPLFAAPTLGRYRSLLSACYHYTRDSGRQLRRAAELAPTDELRDFFLEMAADERDHYRLAEADLAGCGADLGETLPGEIAAFAAYWDGIGPEDFFQLLGATYVLENVAARLRQSAIAALSSLALGRSQVRFVLTHLQADVEHGRNVAAMCAKHAADHGPAILAGAQAAARHWADGVRGFLADADA